MHDTGTQEVCEQLDQLLMRIIENYEQLQALYQRLTSSMSSGHINIAQTRHFRGPQTVGESQYPANIAAILKAQITSRPAEKLAQLPENDRVRYTFSPMQCEVEPKGESTKDGELRKRGGPSEHVEDVADTEALKEKSRRRSSDPLRWFGILVPAPLRNAQKDFKAATTTVLEMATLKSQMLMDMDAYDQLMAEKTRRSRPADTVDAN